jgi:hypothetical protein
MRLAHYINNFPLVEKYINKAIELEKKAPAAASDSPHQNIPNPRFLTNLEILLYKLTPEQIKKLYLLIAVLTKDLPEKLYFIANYNPGILIGLDQVTENLTQLNNTITLWNNHIKTFQAIQKPNIQDIATYISYFLNITYTLFELGVEGTLMSIKISMDHLVEYARTEYKDHKSFELYGKLQPEVEKLMPELDERAKGIRENLDSMRIN